MNEENAETHLAKQDERTTAIRAADSAPEPSPLQLMQLGIQNGLDVGALEKLQQMCERAADRRAAQEFTDALSRFQSICPPIGRNRQVDYGTSGGNKAKYTFANLDDIVRAIAKPLGECGLAYSFTTEMVDGGLVEVCTLRHIGGHHVVSRSPVVPMDTKAGMSSQQKAGSAQTYARRYALTGTLGITTGDQDDDEIALYGKEGVEKITDAQVTIIRNELKARGGSESSFLEWANVTMLGDIPAGRYDKALEAIRRKPLKKDKSLPEGEVPL